MIDPADYSEFTPEEIKDFNRRISELRQSWNDRLQFSNLSLVQHYLAGNLQIHLHGVIDAVEGVSKEFCAVLSGPSERLDDFGIGQPECDVTLSWVDPDFVRLRNCCEGNKEKSMLLGVVELMKDKERRLPGLTFVVGLHTLDQCNRATSDALHYSLAKRLFVLGGCLADGKRNPEFGSGVFAQNERPYEMVKAAAQVMQDFARDHRKPSGNDVRRIVIENLYNAQSGIAVDISDKTIAVRIGVGIPLQLRCKVTDVLVGPFNLSPTSIHQV